MPADWFAAAVGVPLAAGAARLAKVKLARELILDLAHPGAEMLAAALGAAESGGCGQPYYLPSPLAWLTSRVRPPGPLPFQKFIDDCPRAAKPRWPKAKFSNFNYRKGNGKCPFGYSESEVSKLLHLISLKSASKIAHSAR